MIIKSLFDRSMSDIFIIGEANQRRMNELMNNLEEEEEMMKPQMKFPSVGEIIKDCYVYQTLDTDNKLYDLVLILLEDLVITDKLATDLSKLFGCSKKFLLELQKQWDSQNDRV